MQEKIHFFLFVIFLTHIISLNFDNLLLHKIALITFALATILLIIFIEEYYKQHNYK